MISEYQTPHPDPPIGARRRLIKLGDYSGRSPSDTTLLQRVQL